MANESFFDEAMAAIRACDKDKAIDVATRALAAGVPPDDMLKKGFVPGIAKMGDLFERGEVFLPELVLAADAMTGAAAVVQRGVARRNGRDEGHGGHRHRPGRRARHRQDDRRRVPAGQRLRGARPRSRRRGRQVHRQGRGGQRRRHRHERSPDDDHARADQDPRRAGEGGRAQASTRSSSAAAPPRRLGPTRSAPTPTPRTPTTASGRSTS